MHAPQPYSKGARRELVVAVMILVTLSVLVPVADSFLVAGLLPVAVLIAAGCVVRLLGRKKRVETTETGSMFVGVTIDIKKGG